ncbi:peptidyl-prolyl cis-trans isomerase [Candidatus Latescibacterota bacterium]
MLKTMRSNTKAIMVIVIVFFVGMIILGWGMDINSGGKGASSQEVGAVNGEKISLENYDRLIRDRSQNLGNRPGGGWAASRKLQTDTWNEVVSQMIVTQEIKKRKITYTDQELLNYILYNPPQFIFQVPFFQEEGRFSFSKYQGFIQNPDNFNNPQTAQILQVIEAQAQSMLPFMKFQDMLTSSVVVSDDTVRDRWFQENDKRTISYVFVNQSRFADKVSAPEQSELQAYYDEHKKDYERKERRTLEITLFPLAATSQDSADVLERVNMLSQRAKNGEDFSDLANGYSEDPGNDDGMGNRRGGDLGYFGRGMMVPEFEEVAFAMKPGETSEPFLSQFGYHIVRLDSLKYKLDDNGKATNEIDQVKARNILLIVEPSSRTREDLDSRVNAFYEELNAGKDLLLLAKEHNLDVSTTMPFDEDATYISFIGPDAGILVNRTFDADPGDILPIYRTDMGQYVLRVGTVVSAGIPPLEEIASIVSQEVEREKRIEYGKQFITRIEQELASGKSLAEAAKIDPDFDIEVKTETVTVAQNVPGLGSRNPVVIASFALKNKGEYTGPAASDTGVGLAVLEEILPVNDDEYKTAMEQVRQQITQERQGDIINKVMTELRENAKIVDNRHLWYGTN